MMASVVPNELSGATLEQVIRRKGVTRNMGVLIGTKIVDATPIDWGGSEMSEWGRHHKRGLDSGRFEAALAPMVGVKGSPKENRSTISKTDWTGVL